MFTSEYLLFFTFFKWLINESLEDVSELTLNFEPNLSIELENLFHFGFVFHVGAHILRDEHVKDSSFDDVEVVTVITLSDHVITWMDLPFEHGVYHLFHQVCIQWSVDDDDDDDCDGDVTAAIVMMMMMMMMMMTLWRIKILLKFFFHI